MTDEKNTPIPTDEKSEDNKPISKPKPKKKPKTEESKDTPMVDNTSSSKDTSSTEKDKRQELISPLLTILSVVALVVGLVFVYPYLSTMFGKQRQVFSSVDQLDERHVQLEKKVSELETLLEQATKIDNFKAAPIGKESAISPSNSTRASFAEEFVELKERVAYLENLILQSQTRMSEVPAVMRKMSFFRKAMLSGINFQTEFANMAKKVEFNDPEVAAILKQMQPLALAGVPQVGDLKREFVNVAREIRRLSISSDLPWYKRFSERMRSLIVVRKDGKIIGEAAEVDQVLSEIILALQNRNFTKAVVLSEKFEDIDSPDFEAWLGKVKDRLFVHIAYPVLEGSALRKLWKKESTRSGESQEGAS